MSSSLLSPALPSLIDSHCHVNFDAFDEDRHEVIKRAKDAGVSKMIVVGVQLSTPLPQLEEGMYCSVGLHPHHAHQEPISKTILEEHINKAGDALIALGETGYDFSRGRDFQKEQEYNFRCHIAVARKYALPVIVHTRDAEEETAQIIQEETQKGIFSGVLHCFTGSLELAKKAMDCGFYVSFSGIVTFKNASSIQEVAKIIPPERLLIETDAPYLAPVPHRGKRNEPSFVVEVARFLANLRGVSYEEIAQTTTNNALRLFSRITQN